MTDNPFFADWDTPFGMPPFDHIRPEHFPPAFERGMEEQLAEIAAIVAAPRPAGDSLNPRNPRDGSGVCIGEGRITSVTRSAG